MATIDDTTITIIGHPWAPIGMGEQLRSHVRAGLATGLNIKILDIFRYAQRVDPAHDALLAPLEVTTAPDGIRIFHVNGDEVDRVLAAFAARGNELAGGYNIIMPAWELPTYPAEWVPALQKFDEVWAISRFVHDSLAASGIKSHVIGQGVQFPTMPLLPRRHFGIRESAFVLLHFFDMSSYAARKNPDAVQLLFDRLRSENPFADLQLVLKVKEREAESDWGAIFADDPQIQVLSTPLDTQGVLSLINACDCFVSLHRAEGFGRGLGEAMALGRLALGTAWSGNLDFMGPKNSLLVRADTIAVRADEYPHGAGQHWADPDLDHAHDLLRPVLADPARGRAIAERGRRDVLQSHGNRGLGLRILDRVQAIIAPDVKVTKKKKKISRK